MARIQGQTYSGCVYLSELSARYRVHLNTFKQWLRRDKTLWEQILQAGYKPGDKLLMPNVVSLIEMRLSDGDNYKAWSKQELASLLNVSVKTVMLRINSVPGLFDELSEYGYQREIQIFTPVMSRVLINRIL